MPTIYRVKSAEGHVAWASSNTTARKARIEMCAQHNLKRTEVEVEPVEVEKGKAGLIEFLNKEVTKVAV